MKRMLPARVHRRLGTRLLADPPGDGTQSRIIPAGTAWCSRSTRTTRAITATPSNEATQANVPGSSGRTSILAAATRSWARSTRREARCTRCSGKRRTSPNRGARRFGKWFKPDLLNICSTGLHKAGLRIATTRPRVGGERGARRFSTKGFRSPCCSFKYSGVNADITSLAEGLSEEIVTGLSRFSYLRVIARSSSGRDAGESGDVRAVGQVLGARYVMEGSLRQAGSDLRVSVQLIDASSGAHLWAETYDRPFRAEDVFALQDDLVPRIVSTLADAHGILPHTMSEALRSKGPDQMSPYEAVLRSFGYGYRRTPEEHATVRAGLERAVQQAPGYADGWAMLSLDLLGRVRLRVQPPARSSRAHLLAARRAADAAPSSAMANNALARALFFRKEWQGFRTAAERALELNPLNGPTVAGLGSMMAYAGDWEHGCALVERAATLNPRHPGFYWFPLFYNAYRKGNYRGALSIALKINMPGFFYTHVVLAAVYGQLGERDAAGNALRELLALKPDIALHVRDELGKWYPPALVAHLIEGLRKAGLAVANGAVAPVASGVVEVTTRTATAQPSIAVLPFANMSADDDQDYFSDGLAEEIINALAQVEGLKVIARTSAFSFKGKNEDIRQIAQALGVTHVLEGSVRRAADRIRVTAQLIAAADGAHLWSERYDRPMAGVFAMQDEIASAITNALKGRLGGAPASPRHYTPRLSAYETFLRGRAHLSQFTPDAWNRAKGLFEQAIALDAEYADPHAELALGYFISGMHGMRPMREVVPFVRAEVDQALALNPSDPRPRFLSGAIALVHDYDWKAAEAHFAASMSATDVSGHARWIYASLYLRGLGRFEESAEEMGRAVQQDPLNATWHAIRGAHLYGARRFDEAIDEALRATELEPNYFVAQHILGETYWASGKLTEAMAAFERANQLAPWNSLAAGWLAAVLWQRGEKARANQLITDMGDSPLPLWGRVVYHLHTLDLDAAAEWYERMIEHRDPFALVYVRTSIVAPLREHHRWPELAALMRLPALATTT